MPESSRFGPLDCAADRKKPVNMTVDGYETIRLIDLERLNQEACAEQMNIARTTVQRSYNFVRKKIAESLVNGRILRIEGGDYRLCDGLGKACAGGSCRRHRFGADGMGAKDKRNVEVVVGASGDAKTAASEYLKGVLKSTGSVCHEHAHQDECGE